MAIHLDSALLLTGNYERSQREHPLHPGKLGSLLY